MTVVDKNSNGFL